MELWNGQFQTPETEKPLSLSRVPGRLVHRLAHLLLSELGVELEFPIPQPQQKEALTGRTIKPRPLCFSPIRSAQISGSRRFPTHEPA